jgi:hypothetical protein
MAIKLENRDRLRDSRKSRNGLCVSNAPAPTGIVVDIDRLPALAAVAANRRATSSVIDAVTDGRPDVNGP